MTKTTMSVIPICIVTGVLLSGCGTPPGAQTDVFLPIGTVLEVMEAITIPASNAFWAASADPPESAEGWLDAERAAIAMAESGNLLLMDARVPDPDLDTLGPAAWYRDTRTFIEAARQGLEAARNRDAVAMNAAGDAIYESCLACHQTYMHPLHDPR